MFDDINLAVKNETKAPKKAQLERVKLISFASLFVVAILSVVVFLVNLRFSTIGIKNQQNQVLQGLSSYNDTIAKVYLLNSRLDDIGTIMGKRKDYSVDVGQVINLASAVKITDYSYDQQKSMSLSISSSSLGDLNNYLNNILKMRDSGTIKNITITALKTDPQQGYVMGLEVLTQ